MKHLVASLLTCLLASAASADDFDTAVGSYLQKHCTACHNGETQEGDFRIDTLSKLVGTKDTPLWAEVRERISSGEMPPEEAPTQPTAEAGLAVVEWLTARIEEGKAARMANRGPVSFHRLSREEYVHAMYDLLGVHVDATDPGGFSDDPDWHGFQRIGSVLTLSPSHIEKYFRAAELALDEAYPAKPVEPVKLLKPSVPNVPEPYRSRLEAEGLLDKVRFDLWPGDKHRYASPGRLPGPGLYRVTIQLSGLKPAEGRAPRLKVYHEKLDRVLFEQDILAPEEKPTTVSFEVHLPEGHHQVLLFNDIPGPSNLPRSGRHGSKPFVSIAHGRIPWQIKLTDEQGNALYPFIILDWAQWEGPLVTQQEQALRDSYMPAADDDMQQVRDGLSRLATRAFRRPLHDGEIDPYMSIVAAELAAGADFRSAMKTAMLAILCSKSFLFVVEGSDTQPRASLNDWELASRLSFFLWSTMPDDTLFDLAAQGKLSDPTVLREQAARMLADPKAQRFAESFPQQWLQLNRVGMFPPDSKLYPEYDAHLEQSMIGESTAYFGEVLRNNLSLQEFLDSNWTMLNPRLAAYYGIEGVETDRFQRVELTPQHHRGGLLTHAATLSLTSDGQRHRPVHRGVWLLETLFNKSPPPPPANVDPIEPNPVDSPKATLRMKLEAHREHASCASCHRKIDPLGLAFENYDAIGRWRTEEVVQQGTGSNPPIDATGQLPDGRSFAGPAEFKQLLLKDLPTFNRAFAEKLATYGLRRTMTIDDRADLEVVATASQAEGYQLKSLVEAFILSDLFRKR